MVYQDYELVATKRVGHSRQKGFLLLKRQFEAAGGINTVYLMTFFGVAGRTFGLRSASPVAGTIMSPAGVASLARKTLTTSGPVLLGLMTGVAVFGNGSELGNLIWNAPTYSREFRAVQKEHYY